MSNTNFKDDPLVQQRFENLNKLRNKGINGYGSKYPRSHKVKEVENNFSQLENKTVSAVGRLMNVRGHGKAVFADLMDDSGTIQIYIRLNNVGEDNFDTFNILDIGDIIGVTGDVFRTRMGEVTISVTDFAVMAKSLRPLPEKWHGLKDVDLRYRHRYVDLIVNEEVKEIFTKRSKIISSIRRYLDKEGFLEVETPILQPIPGGGNAKPFITHHNTLDMDLYLRIAVELYLKKLIVGGIEKVYEIGKNFRNEGFSYKHNPEFTMLELYQVNTNYKDMMDITEALVGHAANEVLGTGKVKFQDFEIDFASPWRRITMVDAVKEETGVDFANFTDLEEARKAAKGLGLKIEDNWALGEILNFIFEEKVEANLIQPTFIYDYPVEISPLAARIPEDPKFTYRFEGFAAGMEIANAFTELNDPLDQRERFERQVALREAGDDEAQRMDEDFLMALEYGMPPTGGLGIGIDRIVMLLTGNRSIREVILFPPMRPQEN